MPLTRLHTLMGCLFEQQVGCLPQHTQTHRSATGYGDVHKQRHTMRQNTVPQVCATTPKCLGPQQTPTCRRVPEPPSGEMMNAEVQQLQASICWQLTVWQRWTLGILSCQDRHLTASNTHPMHQAINTAHPACHNHGMACSTRDCLVAQHIAQCSMGHPAHAKAIGHTA